MSRKPEASQHRRTKPIKVTIGSNSIEPPYEIGEPDEFDPIVVNAPMIEEVGAFNLRGPCKHCGHGAFIIERNNSNHQYRGKCGGKCGEETKFYPWPGPAITAIKRRLLARGKA